MITPFETIKRSFQQLFSFLLHDLEFIVSQAQGGNYAAVLLAMSACEALGRVRYGGEGKGSQFFAEYLLPVAWQPLAPDLYNALRNGLAHSYDTKTIMQVGSGPIELVVSWRERPHLSFDPQTRQLFINVQQLARALQNALDRYKVELRSDSTLCQRYDTWSRRDRQVDVPATRRPQWQARLEELGHGAS